MDGAPFPGYGAPPVRTVADAPRRPPWMVDRHRVYRLDVVGPDGSILEFEDIVIDQARGGEAGRLALAVRVAALLNAAEAL